MRFIIGWVAGSAIGTGISIALMYYYGLLP